MESLLQVIMATNESIIIITVYCIALLNNCRMFLYLYVLFAPYTHAAAGDHGDKGER
jgi:hypothetical protein